MIHQTQPAGDIARRLEEAIARMNLEMARVEIWAAALSAFVKPIPDYDFADSFLLGPDGRTRQTARGKSNMRSSS